MDTSKAWDILREYIKKKKLQVTAQRKTILDVFLKSPRHLSVDDLFALVRKSDAGIGHATVFRTVKILCDCGIAHSVDLGGKVKLFEAKYGQKHHDHLVCRKCHRIIETLDPEIEKLQERLCKKSGFTPDDHKLEIFGICERCSKKITLKRK